MGSHKRPHRESEGEVEDRIVDCARARGGIAYKFTSPSRRAVPDRLVVLPFGVSFFIEAKANGRRATKAQAKEHKRLRDLGARVYVCSSRAQVDAVFALEFRTPAAEFDQHAGLKIV